MAEEEFDFTLLGDEVVKPSMEISADPVQVLTNKGVSDKEDYGWGLMVDTVFIFLPFYFDIM